MVRLVIIYLEDFYFHNSILTRNYVYATGGHPDLPSSVSTLCWHPTIKCKEGGREGHGNVKKKMVEEGESFDRNQRCQAKENQPSRTPGLGTECKTVSSGAKQACYLTLMVKEGEPSKGKKCNLCAGIFRSSLTFTATT